jgi:hypothetical protein
MTRVSGPSRPSAHTLSSRRGCPSFFANAVNTSYEIDVPADTMPVNDATRVDAALDAQRHVDGVRRSTLAGRGDCLTYTSCSLHVASITASKAESGDMSHAASMTLSVAASSIHESKRLVEAEAPARRMLICRLSEASLQICHRCIRGSSLK